MRIRPIELHPNKRTKESAHELVGTSTRMKVSSNVLLIEQGIYERRMLRVECKGDRSVGWRPINKDLVHKLIDMV